MKLDIEKIETLRKGRGLSREDLAKLSDITYSAYYYITERRSTTLKTLSKIAKALKTSPQELICLRRKS